MTELFAVDGGGGGLWAEAEAAGGFIENEADEEGDETADYDGVNALEGAEPCASGAGVEDKDDDGGVCGANGFLQAGEIANKTGNDDARGEAVKGVADQSAEECSDACADDIGDDPHEGGADGGVQAGLGDDNGGDGGPHGALKVEEVKAEDGQDAGDGGFSGIEEGLDEGGRRG